MTKSARTRVAPGADGNLDDAWYLSRTDGPGGFLTARGWFGLRDDPAPLTAVLRLEKHNVVIPCREPRADVAAAFPRIGVACGFDVTVPIDTDPADGAVVSILFQAGGRDCGHLVAAIERPEQAVEAASPGLAPLRLHKLRNLVLNERERLSQVETVTALPVTGQIDPAFHCNLQCPHCLSDMIRQDGYAMPLMKLGQLDAALEKYGDALVRIWLSLWGEPLLNKNLPAMIERCKQHDIWVLISSNMSVPLTDMAVEALVRSGLDSIVLSVDGATQASYETYRRNGDLGLVLANAERLVRAKRRLGSKTPFLYWRFLTFPWNRHEVEAARALAASIGVDEFGIEPGVLTPHVRHSRDKRPADQAPLPQDAGIRESWRRMARQRTIGQRYFGCDYLYSSISVNANGMVHPCCYVVSPAHAVGDVRSAPDALRNDPVMRASRRLFARIAADEAAAPEGHDPCLSCPVVADTGGHVVTQTGFRQAYDYLLRGIPMGW